MFDAIFSTTDGYAPDGLLAGAYAYEADTHPGPAGCAGCAKREVCVTQGLGQFDVIKPGATAYPTRIVRQGETLVRTGDAFRSIYPVRTGSFKTVMTHRDGMEQIAGFQFPGDVIGFDGLHAGRHEVTAIALEYSTVCVVPFSLLEKECRESRALQHQVYALMSAEIVRESGLMMLLGVMKAEERVGAFLLNIATRMQQRGFSASSFNLRMTRGEIGSYLGLTLETVSRMLSRFQRDGLIRVHGKQVQISDPDGLRAV